MRVTAAVLACSLFAATLPAGDAESAEIQFDGIGIEVGSMNPENASTALSIGTRVELGTFIQDWLDLSSGLTFLDADRDDVPGEIQDLRLHASLAMDLFDASGVKPYLITGPAVHIISADVPERPLVEDALDGLNFGWDVGGGLASTRGSLGLRAEFRSQFVNNVNAWGILVGVGWSRDPGWGY